MKTLLFLCSLVSLSAMSQNENDKNNYPETKPGDQQDMFFGTAIKDPSDIK